MQAYRSRRPAFTLIELLVVIAIITILAALTAIFFPRFQDQELVNRGADQLQGWLLAAKMQAKRDRLPTGFRLILDPSGNVTSLSYIQQPDNFALGTYIGADTDPNPATIPNPPFPTFGFPRAKFSLPAGVTFFTPITVSGSSDPFVIQPGDYLEVYGGGVLHRIARIPQPSTDPVAFFPPDPLGSPANASLILESTTALPLPNPPPPPRFAPPLCASARPRTTTVPAPASFCWTATTASTSLR